MSEEVFVLGAGRPVRNVEEMAFDFNGDDYLDPAEEAEVERYLDDDDDDFDEDLEDEDDWEDEEDWDDDDSDDDW